MTISGDYPTPVTVNGYQCKNCTDVDYAKKHIDPQHPKSGPYGINAATDPGVKNNPAAKRSQAVSFGGSLSNFTSAVSQPAPDAQGAQLDISA